MATTRLPDDSTAGARNLGTLDRRRRIRGSLSISSRVLDLDDFFKFNVASNETNVVLALRNLQANADLRLLDSAGASIAFSGRRGRRNERIARTLEAGEYFIQVSQDGVNTRYTLVATPLDALGRPVDPGNGGGGDFPPPITPSRDPGSIPATAFDTGVLVGSTAYRNTLSNTDTADFYSFTLNQSSQFRLLTNSVEGGDVETSLVYDINGNQIVDGQDVLQTGSIINKALGAGTYFIGVTPTTITADEVSYTLQFRQTTITGLNPTADPPLGLGGATDLGVVVGSLSRQQIVSTSDVSNPALVGTFDSTDIYKFTLTSEASNFSALVNTTQTTGDLTFSLIYDENGNGIANPGVINDQGFVILGDFPGGAFTGSSEGGSALAINKTLGAGTYFLAVTQKAVTENTTYSLDLFVNNTITGLSAVGDPANGSISTAFNVGVLTQNVSFKQFVGITDPVDVYTFTVDQPRNVIIRYNGTPELAGIRFGRDYDGNGILDPYEDLNNNRILDPGEGRSGPGGTFFPFTEDVNGNGGLDPGEDRNGNGRLDLTGDDTNGNGVFDPPEDINGNGLLDRDVFAPDLVNDPAYSPLPPFFDQEAAFDNTIDTFLTPGIATDIYVNLPYRGILPIGTYVVEINRQTIQTDLGDGLARYGGANIIYNLSFILDP